MLLETIAKARDFYMAAYELAEKELPPLEPVRLGLILNFSVFYYEIAHDKGKASQIAKQVILL